MMKHKITPVFPNDDDISAEISFNIPTNITVYLKHGELIHWDGEYRNIFSPICIQTPDGPVRKNIGRLPLLTKNEALGVLESSMKAYDHGKGMWPTLPVEERISHIRRFAQKMTEQKKSMVNLLMWEIGKSLDDANKEFDRTITYIYETIDALKDLDRISSRFIIEQGIIGQIRRSPLGIVLCMGPYNYPLNETFTTLIPALIMGNVVIFKPPRHGALLFQPLLDAFQQAFPRGVVNFICGEGRALIPPLMASGNIHVLALIGNSKTANVLRKAHPKPNRLRCVLGLEAKNPAIVLPDADIDVCVRECVTGSLSFNGQRCTALKILFVHVDIIDNFLQQLVSEIEKKKIGMPWEEGVFITPLPEPEKPAYLSELIEDAIRNGAKIVNRGGGSVYESFVYPSVLCPVTHQMRIYFEEQFGPVIPVVPFNSLDQPVKYIIESSYGQQVSIFSRDPDLISSLVDHLVNQLSRVNINSQCQRGPDSFPFTGRKDSAEGTLSVADALRAFSIRSLVALRENDTNKNIITDIVRRRKSGFLSTDYIL